MVVSMSRQWKSKKQADLILRVHRTRASFASHSHSRNDNNDDEDEDEDVGEEKLRIKNWLASESQ